MLTVTSGSNPAVKEARQLKNRKDREEKGLYFIEGARIVEEALAAGARISTVFVTEAFLRAGGNLAELLEKSGCRTYSVTDQIFREISDTETPQGILAVVRMSKMDLNAAEINGGLFVILDSVRDPGNMGTIIRTADAAGFSGVVICKGCVDVYNPKVLRSTMGSIFHIPLYSGGNAVDAVKALKSRGIKVFASHLDGKSSIYQADLAANAAIVVGSEAEGISDETAEASDLLVRIPMPGAAESLNASVAAAIMMFESVRQREQRNMC
jgi:TrmH family RNA methyltransferase